MIPMLRVFWRVNLRGIVSRIRDSVREGECVGAKKVGPSGPRAQLVCLDRSASLSARGLHLGLPTRGRHTTRLLAARDAKLDYSRGNPAAKRFLRRLLRGVSRRVRRQPSAGGSSTIAPSRCSTLVAARSSSSPRPSSACSQRSFQAARLASILSLALLGQTRYDHPAVGLGAHALHVPAVGQVIEHLRHRSRTQPRGGCQLARGQLAALVQLDQQFELGMAQLLCRRGACRARAAC